MSPTHPVRVYFTWVLFFRAPRVPARPSATAARSRSGSAQASLKACNYIHNTPECTHRDRALEGAESITSLIAVAGESTGAEGRIVIRSRAEPPGLRLQSSNDKRVMRFTFYPNEPWCIEGEAGVTRLPDHGAVLRGEEHGELLLKP